MNTQEYQILQSIVSEEQYINIVALLNHSKNPIEYKFVSDWNISCLESEVTIKQNELILAAIDQELKTQGIESILDDDSNKVFSYCNPGDEFGLTVMYHHPTSKFIVSSFLNIIEAIEEDMLEMFLSD